MMRNDAFWEYVDSLVCDNQIIIDRPKCSSHPKYTEIVYPLDYGYLHGTSSSDGEGIDVWVGSGEKIVDAIVCIIDIIKKETEIKILIGCTDFEKETILRFHNQTSGMKGILVERK